MRVVRVVDDILDIVGGCRRDPRCGSESEGWFSRDRWTSGRGGVGLEARSAGG